MIKYGRDKSDYDIARIIPDKDLHSAVSPGHEWDRESIIEESEKKLNLGARKNA